jgi:hypothetical protein
MVMGPKRNKLERLNANEDSNSPSWNFSAVDDDFHGCRYPNEPADIAQQIPTRMKLAGNNLLRRFPNRCLGRFLNCQKKWFTKMPLPLMYVTIYAWYTIQVLLCCSAC